MSASVSLVHCTYLVIRNLEVLKVWRLFCKILKAIQAFKPIVTYIKQLHLNRTTKC